MKKKIYMKPTVGVVNADGEELMSTSVNATSLDIDYGGNASDNGITSGDAKVTNLWDDED